jgi:gamma-glutamylcyclotransferase (GGCT)/AIG2-like uncharacterized protein YtfP
MASAVTRLFVYGTLMRGECRHHYIERCKPTRIQPATVAGKLFDYGEYPGLVTGRAQGASRVRGELMEFPDIEAALALLDRVEGVRAISSAADEYRREIVEAALSDGTRVPAWAYVAARIPRDARLIRSGNWRLWRRVRSPK